MGLYGAFTKLGKRKARLVITIRCGFRAATTLNMLIPPPVKEGVFEDF